MRWSSKVQIVVPLLAALVSGQGDVIRERAVDGSCNFGDIMGLIQDNWQAAIPFCAKYHPKVVTKTKTITITITITSTWTTTKTNIYTETSGITTTTTTTIYDSDRKKKKKLKARNDETDTLAIATVIPENPQGARKPLQQREDALDALVIHQLQNCPEAMVSTACHNIANQQQHQPVIITKTKTKTTTSTSTKKTTVTSTTTTTAITATETVEVPPQFRISTYNPNNPEIKLYLAQNQFDPRIQNSGSPYWVGITTDIDEASLFQLPTINKPPGLENMLSLKSNTKPGDSNTVDFVNATLYTYWAPTVYPLKTIEFIPADLAPDWTEGNPYYGYEHVVPVRWSVDWSTTPPYPVTLRDPSATNGYYTVICFIVADGANQNVLAISIGGFDYSGRCWVAELSAELISG